MEATLREIKIRTGSLKRLRKEFAMYNAEEKHERAKVQKLVDAMADPHDIKYAESVLAESTAMVPDTRHRLEAALAELQGLLDDADPSLASSDEAELARAELSEAQALFA